MARKKTTTATGTSKKKYDPNTFDLGQITGEAGFTLLSDSTWSSVTDYMPTGISGVDWQLNGGLPFSRFTEIYAPEGVGKSMTALEVTAMAVPMGAIVIWVDVEGTASKEMMESQGIDITRVIVKQPEGAEPLTIEGVGESIIHILEKLDGVDAPVIIIWDSIGQTPSRKEIANDFDNEQPGIQAKAITKMIKKVAPTLSGRNVLFIGINQARDKIGGMPTFGNPIDTSGGRALKHYASVRLELRKGKEYKPTINKVATYVGHNARFILKKSKISNPMSEGRGFVYGKFGLNPYVNTIQEAIHLGLLKGNQSEVTVVNEDGESVKMKLWEAFEWCRTPEAFPIVKQLFQDIILHYFPNWYLPLNNDLLDIELHPLYEGLRAKYEALGKTEDGLDIDPTQFDVDEGEFTEEEGSEEV